MNELMTIDELGAATGVPTRTIRQYQTFGLLAPPSREGRVGRYGPTHRERLDAIIRLQERGYSLAGMRDLFDAWERGKSFETVVGLKDGQPQAPVDEASMRITQDQLVAMVPAFAKLANRRSAVRAGLIRQGASKDLWLVRSPAALATIADLIGSGISVARALSLHEELAASLRALGRLIAAELVAVEPNEVRSALLQRSRPRIGRTAATMLIAAIGEHLPTDDTDRIRIGMVEDRR